MLCALSGDSAQRPPRRTIGIAGAILAAAAVAVHLPSLHSPFLFDDTAAILDNPSIRRLSTALAAPPGGTTTAGRPLANFSFALNYAVSGTRVWGYHAVNIAAHAFAGLALFGVLHRTWRRLQLPPRTSAAALPLSFAAALCWAVHPLHTESVTYVVQRVEVLAGLFCLLTLYCFIRSVDARRPQLWQGLSVLACAAGMACKEIAVSVPLLVLLYDRTFVSGSFAAALSRRRGLYLGLSLGWLLLGWLMLRMGGARGTSAGFGLGLAWWEYAATQSHALLLYLRLTLWPHPLVFDYGIKLVPLDEALLPAVGIAALLAVTLVGLWRRHPAAFAGAVFFAILAPSSSIVPITTQTIAEHRMYLPLAPLLAVALAGLFAFVGRPALVSALVLIVGFGVLTIRRNHGYRSAEAIWYDTLTKQPQNPRAVDNYAQALTALGRWPQAIPFFEQAARLNPKSYHTRGNLGTALLTTDRKSEAPLHFQAAATLAVDHADYTRQVALLLAPATAELIEQHLLPASSVGTATAAAQRQHALALYRRDRLREAEQAGETLLQSEAGDAFAYELVGYIRFALGDTPAALRSLDTADRLRPDLAAARPYLAKALFFRGRFHEAILHYLRLLQLEPNSAESQHQLATAYAETGQVALASHHYEEALRIEPSRTETRHNFGNLLAATGRLTEAIAQYRAALRTDARLMGTRLELATALLRHGALEEAAAHFRAVLEHNPRLAPAHNNLGVLLLQQGRAEEAARHFEQAVVHDPNYPAARDNLQRARAAASRSR